MWQASGNQIPPPDLHRQFLFARIGTADIFLQLLGSLFTDQHIIFSAHIFDNRIIKFIAGTLIELSTTG